MQDASLARYAGRFVWLELNFDGAQNQPFLSHYDVTSTPSFFVLDPADEHATATQFGAMTLQELSAFLERGQHGVFAKANTPAEAALARGDALLASDDRAGAAAAYEQALRAGGKTWPDRDRAVASFAWALMSAAQTQRCAETAAAEAPGMKRSPDFGRLVLAGLMCVDKDVSAPWANTAAKTLEPLATEAIALPVTVRDHRFELYQNLMSLADQRGDKANVKLWGDRWLNELDATHPANDDERTALDIARVDAASILAEPSRVLPALIASERAMPDNYNASLRLAQMELAAKHYPQTIAACERGLKHVDGPLGRSWLLQVKADALLQAGHRNEAEAVLQDALRAAQQIPAKQARQNNVRRVSDEIRKAQIVKKQTGGSL